ncbi:hypothetical protein Pmani_034551 [Petrolisthes manimaculis]|uniref:Uncharacterized protein n=1 Tax=Petrolisthes manimaculis TaxID=1843537 RepID=A0AAE1TPA4_9EUCA|nr:hypothetical protein Pmani_034551 [Petrolisthes manimaculis]
MLLLLLPITSLLTSPSPQQRLPARCFPPHVHLTSTTPPSPQQRLPHLSNASLPIASLLTSPSPQQHLPAPAPPPPSPLTPLCSLSSPHLYYASCPPHLCSLLTSVTPSPPSPLLRSSPLPLPSHLC